MCLDLKETWYIGDSYGHDIASAKAAGWNTIWMNRDKKAEAAPDGAADHIVHTEEELRDCIQNII